MSGNPKFAILERDGEEYAGPVEYVPESEDILYEEGGESTVKDILDGPPTCKRRFAADVKVVSGEIMFLHEPELCENLILEGDVVIL